MRQFRPATLENAPHAHPLVRRMLKIMSAQHATAADVCERAGITKMAVSYWKTRSIPKIDTFDAALNVLGYELRIVRKGTGRPSLEDEV